MEFLFLARTGIVFGLFLFSLQIKQLKTLVRNLSEFLYSGLFGYITIKLNLTFISQQKLEY
ncbi:hypothetical protein DPP92_04665 [Salmonella enterica subsp. enterica serovar Havana]|nr:hypothetical protein [Salmonella enterica subsp. enterica serovar Havana]EBW4856877.1 hypothetical protein [Salmonella enterica subsp. enterica serovar Havana]